MALVRSSSIQAHADYELAKRVRNEARQIDTGQFNSEAIAVGFMVMPTLYQGGFNDLGIELLLNSGPSLVISHVEELGGQHWIYKTGPINHHPTAITPESIEEHGFTQEQVHFLEWSRVWEEEIWHYWAGDTPFTTIEEFIDDLKQNIEHVYSSPHIKSSSKTE